MFKRLTLVLMLGLLASACITSVEETVEESSVEIEAGTNGLFLTEVAFGGGVTIANEGAGSVSLDGMWLCNRPSYVPLSGALAGGESITIDAGGLGGLAASGGEVGLYTSRSFGDSSAMVDYVAWGSGGGRTDVAVGAGLWESETSAPNDASSITRTDSAPRAENWSSSG